MSYVKRNFITKSKARSGGLVTISEYMCVWGGVFIQESYMLNHLNSVFC